MIVDYIDAHRKEFGVDPICRVLTEHEVQIAPSTYYAAKKRGHIESPRVSWRAGYPIAGSRWEVFSR